MSQYVFRVFEDEGIAYTEEELDGLLPVMQEVNNNTGILCNCGYTPARKPVVQKVVHEHEVCSLCKQPGQGEQSDSGDHF